MAANRPSKPTHDRSPTPKPEERPVPKAPANEIVVTIPARCVRPSCRSTDVVPTGDTPDVTACVTTVRGLPVTHIVRERMRCQACGQQFVRVEHQNR